DRLLPTLRAAQDPVTRDLYVTRVAEALGVSAPSIQREMELGGAPIPRRPERERTATEREAPPARTRPGPERDLVRVMVHEPGWRPRIIEQLGDLARLREPDRQLIALLGATPASVPPGDLLPSCEGDARVTLADLLAEPWGALDLDAIVSGAINKLDGRRLEAELRDLARRLPLAPEEDKPELTRLVNTLSRQIAKLDPGRWNVIRRGGRVGS
ncbi:MAG: hypothetical protein HY560_02900, partial [Gemmatimonadetes bacterium]|nr:hypothetical protein [Gemmatimonadota bacterium]